MAHGHLEAGRLLDRLGKRSTQNSGPSLGCGCLHTRPRESIHRDLKGVGVGTLHDLPLVQTLCDDCDYAYRQTRPRVVFIDALVRAIGRHVRRQEGAIVGHCPDHSRLYRSPQGLTGVHIPEANI